MVRHLFLSLCVFYALVRTLLRYLGRRAGCQGQPLRHPSRSRRACRCDAWDTRIFSNNRVRTALCCSSARQSSLKYRRARWTRATADALLQATRAAEERAMRAERTAALAERGVGFLKVLNVCPRPPLECFVASFPSGMLTHLPRIGELRQRRSCARLW